MILLLAVVEFGLILAAAKHVEFASRLGAKLAAESANLDTFNQPATSNNLKTQVDRYLNTAGYTNSCQVILESNVTGFSNTPQPNPTTAACPCTPVPSSSLPMQAVRVTVCLPMTGNIPNVLSTFGYDVSVCSVRQSTVWIYEQP